MGLIKAGMGALGGTLADQWKEFFYCEALGKDVLVTKGQKRITGRSSNTKGNDNIISNGSGIAVADGQCMLIVEQGRVVEVCAEPGEFTYDTSSEPSIFAGKLGESIRETFKVVGKRFTFGGADGAELRRRVFEEVAEEYRPTVEYTMQTTGLALYPESEALLRLPAFLPVYFMDCGEVQAAVNGQTGKVSVLAEKETRTYPWVIEPLLGTLAVMFFFFFAFRNYGGVPIDLKELFELVGMAGLVAALILFTVFSKGREARVRRKILKSISEEEKKKPEDSIKPVFFETIGGKELPVQLGFYSPGRIVKIVMILLLVNASTCILAWILTAFKCMGSGDWTLFQQLDYSYNIIWLCLALPISMVGFAVFGRIEVYDSPVIFQLLENGKRKRIHQKRENRKTLLMRWKNVRETMGNWALPLFIVLPLFVMTVYMIMNPWP